MHHHVNLYLNFLILIINIFLNKLRLFFMIIVSIFLVFKELGFKILLNFISVFDVFINNINVIFYL